MAAALPSDASGSARSSSSCARGASSGTQLLSTRSGGADPRPPLPPPGVAAHLLPTLPPPPRGSIVPHKCTHGHAAPLRTLRRIRTQPCASRCRTC